MVNVIQRMIKDGETIIHFSFSFPMTEKNALKIESRNIDEKFRQQKKKKSLWVLKLKTSVLLEDIFNEQNLHCKK